MAARGEATKQVIYAPDAVPALPVFCHAAVDPATGLIFCSGSIGCNDKYQLPPGGVRAQTAAALDNLAKVLRAAGSTMEQIVKVNVYLTNMQQDFGPMNEVYAQYFRIVPARTCVGVATLPLGACVEIECVALPGGAYY
ncbi:YjgF-like protein [Calocera cornea HHB12733]|uniref:YjgF-like protein n=1 Tax=Calocera cornea HHB12733 TaxID=1353952 RepID=A0A165DLY5_9BASI|nr:YjgF-like protein [Calocera cornea HHB12733]